MTTITIQLANTPTGEYDVKQPLPFPFHIDAETGDVARQDFWHGDPSRLLGFQVTAEVQRVAVFLEDWAKKPQKAVGMFPVFLRGDGSMFNFRTPITTVTVQEG